MTEASKSLCELIRDSDPNLEIDETFPVEDYVNILFDYNEWKNNMINEYRISYNRDRHSRNDRLAGNLVNNILQFIPPIISSTKLYMNIAIRLEILFFKYYDRQPYQQTYEYLYIDEFKKCKGFMTKSVGIYKKHTIEARSFKFEDVQSVREFVMSNNLIIYKCIQYKGVNNGIILRAVEL